VASDCDIVVTNGYPIENQPLKGVWPGNVSLKDGGILVLIAQSMEGNAHHYLGGRFGTDFGGNLWGPPSKPLAQKAKQLLCLSPCLSKVDLDFLGPAGSVLSCKTWADVVMHLLRIYPSVARVAIYPYAAIQMPARSA